MRLSAVLDLPPQLVFLGTTLLHPMIRIQVFPANIRLVQKLSKDKHLEVTKKKKVWPLLLGVCL
jgi:hypothetical protein